MHRNLSILSNRRIFYTKEKYDILNIICISNIYVICLIKKPFKN
jgi:hypothetical protein